MQFSVYDYKNRFLLPGQTDSARIYTGTTETEKKYGYMRQVPGAAAEGADVGTPYYAEFRISEATAAVKLTVEGARPIMDSDGFPAFKADGSPEDAGLQWEEVGTLTVPQAEAGDPIPRRVAFSNSRNKWFRAKVTGGKATAFLLRG